MRRISIYLQLITLLSVFLLENSKAQKNYFSLHFYSGDLAGELIQLGYCQGDKYLFHSEISLNDQGAGRFDKLSHPGIYFVLLPDSSKYEFMVTDTGRYTIAKATQGFSIKANPASEAYDLFRKYSQKAENRIDSLQQYAKSKAEFNKMHTAIRKETDSLIHWLAMEQKDNLAGIYFKALMPVPIPDFQSLHPDLPDSVLWSMSMDYFRSHYLDNITWDEPTLIYTPAISGRLTTYLTRITQQTPEGQVKAVEKIMEGISNTDTRDFVLDLLFRHYRSLMNRAYCEYAFIFLAEHYLLTDPPTWIDDNLFNEMQYDIARLKPLAIGSPAPDIRLPDQDDRICVLSGLKADATVILFWDYSCPTCRKVVNEFKKVMDKYYYKNVQVYTVFIGSDKEVWEAWVVKKLGSNWNNTFAGDDREITKTYYISQTPALFLLDENKLILNKHFTMRELDHYLFELPYGE